MSIRAWVVLVVVLGGVVGGGVGGYAQGEPPASYFWEEFTYGLLGGFVGGPVFEWFYVGLLCSENPDPALCTGLGIFALRSAIYLITLPGAASVGIVAAGWLRGVGITPRRVLFTYGFAAVGSLTGFAWAAGIVKTMEFFIESLGWEFLIPWTEPVFYLARLSFPIFLAALLGTVGFNADAEARPPTALPLSFSVPIFELRF
ncbi:MAG: hypothetical protein NZ610_03695 [Candidatus Bipolaricaulota bacterium]|nr:hypothetical protein [Candidatus Bipolaricaulota bacterium]MCS7274494.1 hypothetical protein [Candidatus Bipolaricaulota bacterium]MDW8111109.1 hypothetical protein [Candidatus Bipolaricaulota bacterium]MDW8329061.1 hypothetical protein [Candidatus Bipolaricaulota bacterium]